MCRAKTLKSRTRREELRDQEDHSWKFNIQFTGVPERESRSREMIKHTIEAISPGPKDASLQPKIVQIKPKKSKKKKTTTTKTARSSHTLMKHQV